MAVRLEAFVATRHVPRVYALLAPVAALAEHGITLAIRTIGRGTYLTTSN